jgi:hypothetical protein
MGRILLRDNQIKRAEDRLANAQSKCKVIKNEPLDIQIKCELALLMLLAKRFSEAKQIIVSIDLYATRKKAGNIKARLNALYGLAALNQKEINQAKASLERSVKDALSWNRYFVRDITEQIIQGVTADPGLIENSAVIIDELINFLEAEAPTLTGEIELLKAVKPTRDNIKQD